LCVRAWVCELFKGMFVCNLLGETTILAHTVTQCLYKQTETNLFSPFPAVESVWV